MILTVSPSTAIDLTYTVEAVISGAVNRATSISLEASGKGINVAAVLTANAVPNLAIVSVPDTPLGVLWLALAAEHRLTLRTVGDGPEMRVNTTLLTETATKVNSPVSPLTTAGRDALIAATASAASQQLVTWIVVAGSVAEEDADPLFAGVRRIADDFGARLAIDTSGIALKRALAHRPDFIKPNKEELEVLVGVEFNELASLADAARDLSLRTGGMVFVSNGGNTGVACAGSDVLAVTPPAITVVNTVGAGDASVAGFVAAASDGQSFVDCVKEAASWGATSCLSPRTVSPGGPTVPRREIRTEWLVPEKSRSRTP